MALLTEALLYLLTVVTLTLAAVLLILFGKKDLVQKWLNPRN